MFSYFFPRSSLYFVLLLLLHYLFANCFVFFFVTPASKFEQKVKRPLKVILLQSYICLFLLLLAVNSSTSTLQKKKKKKKRQKLRYVFDKHETAWDRIATRLYAVEFKETAHASLRFSVRISRMRISFSTWKHSSCRQGRIYNTVYLTQPKQIFFFFFL